MPPPGQRRWRWRRLGKRLLEPFPEVDGNSIRPLDLGSKYYLAMRYAIEAARSSVDVEMYLWHDDEVGRLFCETLRDAAARGLRVRVLVDAFGSYEVLDDDLDAVADAGGDVRAFNPFRVDVLRWMYHRTHKKLLVVDGERAFCGGAGFSKHFSGVKNRERPWHDRMFELQGPVVAQLVTAFEADFDRWKRTIHPAAGPVVAPPGTPDPAGEARGRVLRGWPDAKDFRDELLARIGAARERVWIGTPYFLPPRVLRRTLRDACKRGVDVQVVLPAYQGASWVLWYASKRHYGWMLRSGGRIFEFGPEFYHAKLAVIDDTAALVGSSNLDAWSWRRNAELDLLLTDTASARMVARAFAADRAKADEIHLVKHTKRGLAARATERLVGWFEDWL